MACSQRSWHNIHPWIDGTDVSEESKASTLPDDLFSPYLEAFAQLPTLRHRVLRVLSSLPREVQLDFVEDERFHVTLENHVPGEGWSFWMASPGRIGEASRCVVLRPRLDQMSEAFSCYVIAHEFAHAFLCHGRRGDGDDVEPEADRLAAEWGFPRPAGSSFDLRKLN